MKNVVFTAFVVLSFILTTNAQNKNKTLFLRVYTLEGKRITGNIYSINDSLLVLQSGKKEISINPNTIRIIKTKHSGGVNVLAGLGIGALIGGLIGSSQEAGWFSTEFNIGAYGVAGATIGGAVGALTLTGKKSKKYRIDGDLEKWKLFLESENLKN